MNVFSKSNLIKTFQNEKRRRWIRFSYVVTLFLLFLCSIFSSIHVNLNQEYTDFRHIVSYIYEYDQLPNNYIPKSQSGTIIGEDLFIYEVFNNYEERLPLGQSYISAYFDSTKTDPGAKRIVFSSTTVYYTEDHYLNFREVSKFEIYGFHDLSLFGFWFVLIGGIIVLTIFVNYNIVSIVIIKEDFKNDLRHIYMYVRRVKEKIYKKHK